MIEYPVFILTDLRSAAGGARRIPTIVACDKGRFDTAGTPR